MSEDKNTPVTKDEQPKEEKVVTEEGSLENPGTVTNDEGEAVYDPTQVGGGNTTRDDEPKGE